jgi:hypothetical protein
MDTNRRAKKGTHPNLEVGNDVRIPVIYNQNKRYKDSFSVEIHKREDKNRGSYTVDGSCNPRKDLQL